MALPKESALTAAKEMLFGPRALEAPRLNFIANAVTPPRRYNTWLNQTTSGMFGGPTVEMPSDAPQVMKNLAHKSRTNFLPLVLDTFAQLLKVDGYLEANGEESSAWSYWQNNGLDARQTGIHRSALQFGASYATVLPGDLSGQPMPVIEGRSPRRMTAIYADPSVDDWPMMALDVNGPAVTLYDETSRYRFGIENYPRSGLGAAVVLTTGQQLVFIDSQSHGMGFCPVVRFRDRMLLDGEEVMGLIEPLIDIQRRIDETTFGMLTAQYYAAFRQRYILGWEPESDSEALKTAVSSLWTFADGDGTVKVGEFAETDLTRYIESKQSALSDMSAIAQVPTSAFNSNSSAMRNVSPEAVASNDAGQDRKGGEFRTSLGESHELMLRTAAAIAGDTKASSDTSSQVRWKDMTTTSPGAIVDALGKMGQMLGIPVEMLWEKIPGFTDQDVDRALKLVTEGDTVNHLIYTLNQQQTPQPPSGEPGPGLAAGGLGNE